MNEKPAIEAAISCDAGEIAVMVGELLSEIMVGTGTQAFDFDLAETTGRLSDFLEREK
jgi:hypothetical protein